jgi:hypothetical protein
LADGAPVDDDRGAFDRDPHVPSIVIERGVNRGTRHEPITLASPIRTIVGVLSMVIFTRPLFATALRLRQADAAVP